MNDQHPHQIHDMCVRPPRRLVSRGVAAATLATTVVAGLGLVGTGTVGAGTREPRPNDRPRSGGAGRVSSLSDVRTLDGSGNNVDNPALGQAGGQYLRVAPATYADGVSVPIDGPAARYLSNRVFNDTGQNVFSENNLTHWSFVWGQFIDHTVSLRENSDEDFSIAFDPTDPLESFTNELGTIAMTRSAAAAGTGVDSPREQINTISSYIDAFAVYGGTNERLDWLRAGPVDGDPTNNGASLLTVDGYLPTATARPDIAAPTMEIAGRLIADPSAAMIAGDARANENTGLLAVHTLFLREHNRIVEQLPADMDQETKFQIARRVVGAVQQYITYNEFLPSMGVNLPRYDGYDPQVDPTISNEFATVGYRPHSQIHGEFETDIPRSEVSDETLAALESQGVEVAIEGDIVGLAIPLNVAFANPELLRTVGLDNMLTGLAGERAYANDEQIDNQLRSVLFQVPSPDVANPLDCLDGTTLPDCFSGVQDLGAIDVARGRDHGIAGYNDLRAAYGLPRRASFAEVTGEDTEEFPVDTEVDPNNAIDDPSILDFVSLADADGNPLELGSEEADAETVTAVRRSTTAARLKAIYADIDSLDAFTGMLSEPHIAGTEFGELQLAIWTRQFEALRDGDRFFYENDRALREIGDRYGVDFRRSLAQVIADNTDVDIDELPASVFVLDAAATAAAADGADVAGTEASDAAGAVGPSQAKTDAIAERRRRGDRDAREADRRRVPTS